MSNARRPAPAKPTKRVKVLKVMVQPVFVVDDGADLEEVAIQVLALRPADLVTLPELVGQLRAQYEAELAGEPRG